MRDLYIVYHSYLNDEVFAELSSIIIETSETSPAASLADANKRTFIVIDMIVECLVTWDSQNYDDEPVVDSVIKETKIRL